MSQIDSKPVVKPIKRFGSSLAATAARYGLKMLSPASSTRHGRTIYYRFGDRNNCRTAWLGFDTTLGRFAQLVGLGDSALDA